MTTQTGTGTPDTETAQSSKPGKAAPPRIRRQRSSRSKPPRWPRIIPVEHGEDPRFDTRAACQLGAAGLFDERDKGEQVQDFLRRVDQARALCARCLVSNRCREFAEENRLSGIFGGVILNQGQVPR